MTQSDLNDIMWANFIRWAYEQPQIVERFHADTGHPRPASDPMGNIINKACGLSDSNANAFVLWATREMWGEEWAPAKVREELRGTK